MGAVAGTETGDTGTGLAFLTIWYTISITFASWRGALCINFERIFSKDSACDWMIIKQELDAESDRNMITLDEV